MAEDVAVVTEGGGYGVGGKEGLSAGEVEEGGY